MTTRWRNPPSTHAPVIDLDVEIVPTNVAHLSKLSIQWFYLR